MDEIELVTACKENNPNARRLLYEKYSAKMMGVCYRYTGNKNTALDLLHDGFIKVFTNLHTYKGNGSLEGWIRRIIVNTVLSHLRKNDALKYTNDLQDADGMIDEEEYTLASNLSQEKIMEFVLALPTGYRTVFNLHAIEGLPHKEIAKQLNISLGTSLSQYAKAKAMLSKKIKQYLQEKEN